MSPVCSGDTVLSVVGGSLVAPFTCIVVVGGCVVFWCVNLLPCQEVGVLRGRGRVRVSLNGVFRVVGGEIVCVVLTALVATILSNYVARFLVRPGCSTSYAVCICDGASEIDDSSSVNRDRLATSRRLMGACVRILGDSCILRSIVDGLGLGVASGRLGDLLSFSRVGRARVFEIAMADAGTTRSTSVTGTVTRATPSTVIGGVGTNNMDILSCTGIPSSPSSPGLGGGVLVNTVTKFTISFVNFFVCRLFSAAVASRESLRHRFRVPIVNDIPQLIPSSGPGRSNTTRSTGAEGKNNGW